MISVIGNDRVNAVCFRRLFEIMSNPLDLFGFKEVMISFVFKAKEFMEITNKDILSVASTNIKAEYSYAGGAKSG